MTPGDWILLAGTSFNVVVVVLGALYLRGKLDGSSTAHETASSGEVVSIRQVVKEASERSIRTEATLISHLDECKRSNEALTESVNMLSHHVDRRFEALSAEINASRSRPARVKSAT